MSTSARQTRTRLFFRCFVLFRFAKAADTDVRRLMLRFGASALYTSFSGLVDPVRSCRHIDARSGRERRMAPSAANRTPVRIYTTISFGRMKSLIASGKNIYQGSRCKRTFQRFPFMQRSSSKLMTKFPLVIIFQAGDGIPSSNDLGDIFFADGVDFFEAW